jgi:hypothetical protein
MIVVVLIIYLLLLCYARIFLSFDNAKGLWLAQIVVSRQEKK